MTIHRHFQELPSVAAGQVPDWLHLIPAGTFKGADGRGPFHVADPAALIANSMARGKLPLDENHSTDLAAPSGAPSPARGWIVEMQAREDGIWGRIEWCDAGRQLMADRAYRGVSPVFDAKHKGGEITRLHRAALTNNPNLLDLAVLHHTQETTLDIAALRTAMGLPETADDAAILAHAAAATQAISLHATQLAAIATASGAAVTTADGLVTHLNTVRTAATDVQAMASKVVSLETQLNAVTQAGALRAATTFVDAAIAAGKPVVALRDHYIARHAKDAAAVETEINGMVSLHTGGLSGASPAKPELNDAGEDMSLNAVEKETCQKFGLDPKKFAENRNKMAKAKMERA